MRIRTVLLRTLATGFVLLISATGALACTAITSLPTTITAPGHYCFTGNLTYSNSVTPAITVDNVSVVLDLSGYRLWYTGVAGTGTAVDVLARRNVTIRNGLISDFLKGVTTAGIATIVEDMRFHNVGDFNFGAGAVDVQEGADGAIVRRNYFTDCAKAIGINANSGRAVDNDIYGSASGSGGDVGIRVTGDNAFLVGNRLGRLNQGILFDLGSSTVGTGKYRDNMTLNVTIPYTNGTNDGNNS